MRYTTLATLGLVLMAALLGWGCAGPLSSRSGPAGSGQDARRTGGVAEIGVEEVWELLAAGNGLVLIDTRAREHYDQGHLPTALSMPAGRMETLANQLPADRDRLLVFYGEGST